MNKFIKRLQKIASIFRAKPMYVITQMNEGVKYYYKGKDSKWTPMIEGAMHYKKKPKLEFVELLYKVEEYYP
jgi:hypothetical protein